MLHSGSSRELLVPQDGRWQVMARESDGIDEIIDKAQEFEPDLIVTSTQGLQGLKARIRGSHIDRLLSELGRPLLSIPSR